MLDKINKLIDASSGRSEKVYDGLVAIAHKVRESVAKGRAYVLVDIKEMESMISPEKVDQKEYMGNVELDL